MRIMSYNTLFGGFDAAASARQGSQIDVILVQDPDVLLLQELKDYTAAGSSRLFEFERRIGRRGLIAIAPVTGQHTAIFVKPGIDVLSFDADADHFHHAAAIARLRIPGFTKTLTAVSVHLCPNSTHVRLREASYLFNLAIDDDLVIVGGDFNSVAPGDPEPPLADLPSRFRARYAGEDGKADRRTLGSLYAAGFVNIGAADPTPTVPGAGFSGTEFVPFRSDYLLTTPSLAALAGNYRVVRESATDTASDHYPVVVDFNAG